MTVSIELQETRGRILNLLKKYQGLTVNQLAEQIEISPMGVRQHLAVLERDGLITYTREKPQRGRPVHRYKLTQEADKLFPNSYENFALSILKAVSNIDGESHVEDLFEARFLAQKQAYTALLDGKDLKEKVLILAKLRDNEGYMAEVEENGTKLFLHEYNCPIYGVASEYQHACDVELRLFRDLLGPNVNRDCHIQKGDHVCTYCIEEESS